MCSMPRGPIETLLGAKGIATRNKKLLGAPGLTRSKDAPQKLCPLSSLEVLSQNARMELTAYSVAYSSSLHSD